MNNIVKIAARGLSSELFAAATCSNAIRAVFGVAAPGRSWGRDRTVLTPEGIDALWSRVLHFDRLEGADGFATKRTRPPLSVEQHAFWYGPEAVRAISEFSIRGCDAIVDVDFRDDAIAVRWGVDNANGGPASANAKVVERWISMRVKRFESFVEMHCV